MAAQSVTFKISKTLSDAMSYLAWVKGTKLKDEYAAAVGGYINNHVKGGFFEKEKQEIRQEELSSVKRPEKGKKALPAFLKRKEAIHEARRKFAEEQWRLSQGRRALGERDP